MILDFWAKIVRFDRFQVSKREKLSTIGTKNSNDHVERNKMLNASS